MLIEFSATSRAQLVGFMPHFESLDRGAWMEAAGLAGLSLIDPRDDPAKVLTAIGNCRLVLSEAMHGAIVADAMRVPWIALRPLMQAHRAKWQDWAGALNLQLRFQGHRAASLREQLHASFLGTVRPARAVLDRTAPWLAGAARQRFIERAAESLSTAAGAAPQLSSAMALDRCRARMLERIEALRQEPGRPRQQGDTALHSCGTSAYQG